MGRLPFAESLAGLVALAAGALVACGVVYPLGDLSSQPPADVPDAGDAGDDAARADAAPEAAARCAYDWADFTAPETGMAFDLALGDVDHDGLLDLALAVDDPFAGASNGGPSIFQGRAGGTFAAWSSEYTPGLTATAIALADLNGDGRPDVVTALDDPQTDHAGQVSVNLASATGTLESGGVFSVDHPIAIALGDVNGDALPDLVVLSDHTFFSGFADERVAVLLGAKTGIFDDPVLYDKVLVGHGDVSGIAVGDVSQDGLADIVLSNWGSSALTLLFGDRSGKLTKVSGITKVCETPWGVGIGDLDGDHLPDLAVACPNDNGFAALVGTGGGFFTKGPLVALVAGAFTMAFHDLDGDGRDDVIMPGDGTVGFRLSSGGGGEFAPTQLRARGSIDHQSAIAVGDIDGDGVKDVVVSARSARYPVVFRGTCK